ncbi:hypothetical protein, partial [Neisseria meningitidis]|uniref:hypothetical protein n=1 Tax=Neisseria meningitidis TaxID=487 RepID=UPI001E5B0DDB
KLFLCPFAMFFSFGAVENHAARSACVTDVFMPPYLTGGVEIEGRRESKTWNFQETQIHAFNLKSTSVMKRCYGCKGKFKGCSLKAWQRRFRIYRHNQLYVS